MDGDLVTSRILPREEWPRLAGTELEAVCPYLPEGASVLVVEDDGDVVGCWAVYPLLHAEGIWIAPAHRGKSSVARRLLAAMRTIVGRRALNTAAIDESVAHMLLSLGAVELPGRHFAVRI